MPVLDSHGPRGGALMQPYEQFMDEQAERIEELEAALKDAMPHVWRESITGMNSENIADAKAWLEKFGKLIT